MTTRGTAEPASGAPQAQRAHALKRWLLLSLPLTLVLLHASLFRRFIIDDAYITYVSARNWARGFGPVFMPNERVEATSSLLWTLLLTPFELLHVGAPLGSKVLGLASAMGVVIACVHLLRKMRPSATYWQQLTLGILVASSATFVLWANYGMENGLLALLLVVAVTHFGEELTLGRGHRSAFFIFLLETIRPEGFLFIALFVVLRLLWIASMPSTFRPLFLRWMAVLSVALLLYELGGYLYFGHLLPNPVAAKVGASAVARIRDGLLYLSSGPSAVVLYCFLGSSLIALPVLLGRCAKLTLPAVLKAWHENPWYLVALATCALQLLFTVLVGGDWMPLGRFVSHIAPLVLVTLVFGYSALAEQAESAASVLPGMPRLLHAAALVTLLLLSRQELHVVRAALASVGALQRQCDEALPSTVAYLNAHASEQDTVAAADIGYLGYFFKGRVYDWWGLANEEITALGQAVGNIEADTVLKEQPRFIVLYSNQPALTSSTMNEGMALYSRPFMASTSFRERYRQVHSAKFSATRYHVTFERVEPWQGHVTR